LTAGLQDDAGSAVAETQRRRALGMGTALFGASSFGFVVVLARFSYEFNTNPPTAFLVSLALGTSFAALMMLVLRRRFALPLAGTPAVLGVTVSSVSTSLCFLTAVVYIPVSLAILIFYTYPLMVAAYTAIVQRSPLGMMRGAAFIAAFAGLTIAFGPSFDGLDWRGLALALAAAASLTLKFLISAAALRHVGVVPLTFYSNVGSFLVMVAIVYALGGPALPTVDAGWFALIGSGLCYTVGIFLHFGAINMIGAARTAMFFNIEPIIAMILAAFFLGESLTLVQYAGSALVIGALVMTSLADRRPTGGS
jgi:drug/metabolite transporter (DMT)-like permease